MKVYNEEDEEEKSRSRRETIYLYPIAFDTFPCHDCFLNHLSIHRLTNASHADFILDHLPMSQTDRLLHGAPWVPIEGSSPWGIPHGDL